MEVILLEKVNNLGNIGDVVNVKPGYARNFLILKKKCLYATKENKILFEEQKANLELENKKKFELAQDVGKKLDGKFFVFIRNSGESGQLYGSVTAKDIVESLAKGGIIINRNQVIIPSAIKYIGVYSITVELHPDVSAQILAVVSRNDEEAEQLLNNYNKKQEKSSSENKEENNNSLIDNSEKQ